MSDVSADEGMTGKSMNPSLSDIFKFANDTEGHLTPLWLFNPTQDMVCLS
jgi:hypothetical protein